jgi:hypothetical protein
MTRLPESFQPSMGLASIELANEPETTQLPEDSSLQPIDAAVEKQLEVMLQPLTFEKVMLDALRPQVEDHSILRPGAFHALRDQILRRLVEAFPKAPDKAASDEVRAAAEFLHHLGEVHTLGEQYRYALLKG